MAELSQAQQVYAAPRTLQVWRSLLNWLAFFFQILLQIFRGTPSFAQFLSSSSSPAFKPLPVHLPHHSDAHDDLITSAVDDDVGDDSPIGKLTVVLDLDETLVCAYETSSLPVVIRNQATEAGLKWFELECVSVDRDCEGKQKVNHVTVFERPGLHEFLQQISEFADLVLFTAGLEGYARPLVDRIDLDNRFSLRLYRPATISTNLIEDHIECGLLKFPSKEKEAMLIDTDLFPTNIEINTVIADLRDRPRPKIELGPGSMRKASGRYAPMQRWASQYQDVRRQRNHQLCDRLGSENYNPGGS